MLIWYLCIGITFQDNDNHKHAHTETDRLTHCHQIVSCPGGMCVATAEPEMGNWDFSWVPDVIYVLRNTSILCSIPSLKFPQRYLWTSSNVHLQSSFQGRLSVSSTYSFYTSLLQAIDGVVLGFVPAGSVPSSSTLQTFWDAVLEMVALLASLSARSFLLTPKQYIYRCLQRWLSNCDTCKSGLPIPLFVACSLDLWGGGCVVWLRPLDAIHQTACTTASTSFSSWRLRSHQLHCLHREWLHLAFKTEKPHSDWFGWLCLQCKLSNPAVCYFLKRAREVLKKVRVSFPLLALLEHCQLAYWLNNANIIVVKESKRDHVLPLPQLATHSCMDWLQHCHTCTAHNHLHGLLLPYHCSTLSNHPLSLSPAARSCSNWLMC